MKVFSQFSENGVDVSLVPGPAGGWDIASVHIHGTEVPPTRKGEFETEQEAKDAALARAAAFAKEQNIRPLR
ncbi:hypothetical protein [Stutzerimonas balearica]|uniref:hypothetical protein n=1 Tax=Stutzerimonas balearica TaxID=74829 RepID=UPI0028ABB321|nr:hypothetical protein [Stutzerimonas balearica]